MAAGMSLPMTPMSAAAMRASDLAAALIGAAADANDESGALMHEAAFRIDARTYYALRGLG